MKYLCAVLVLAALVYGGWPYVHLYRLDRALMENDRTALNELVDLDALKEQHKTELEKRVDRTFGVDPKRVPEFLRQGARWIDDATANAVVDVDWVREQLRWRRPTPPDAYPSIITDATFAFFEAPTRFLIRVGDLGERPVHVRMALQDWHWRVTEIYN
jgi:hypothetical protein